MSHDPFGDSGRSQVNHLSPFFLTELLLPNMRKAHKGRFTMFFSICCNTEVVGRPNSQGTGVMCALFCETRH